ncbi:MULTISPECIES: hypothetical protein [Bacillus]|uniref:hypothetical protein n=1 Tax=Bacillus TaxID=1386 RepID=UPI00168D0BAC|nr:hypothetical protein [Bacillus sp. 28A-2]MBD3861792.1 hypothetical protein [Bacillus sp. 28A-2]MCA0926776.1 hypothetical protein [Bacillus stratosphericus]
MKKICLFVFAFVVVLSLSLPNYTFAKDVSSKGYTVEDYEKYLANYDQSDAINAGVSTEYLQSAVLNAKKQLKEFRALSRDDQELFVKSLFNVSLSEQTVLEEDTNKDSLLKSSLMAKASASSKDYTVSYTVGVGIFGADISKYKVSVTYNVKGGKVKKINSSSAYVVSNYNPVVRTGLNSHGKNAWVTSDNKAAVTGNFYYNIGPLKDLSVGLGTLTVKTVGNKNGTRTYTNYWKE